MTTMKPIFAKACGAVLLIATCMGLSSCIVVERHHRRYPYRGGYYSQEVRP